jgi:hypothetical protein
MVGLAPESSTFAKSKPSGLTSTAKLTSGAKRLMASFQNQIHGAAETGDVPIGRIAEVVFAVENYRSAACAVSSSPSRKPRPGMLLDLMLQTRTLRYSLAKPAISVNDFVDHAVTIQRNSSIGRSPHFQWNQKFSTHLRSLIGLGQAKIVRVWSAGVNAGHSESLRIRRVGRDSIKGGRLCTHRS